MKKPDLVDIKGIAQAKARQLQEAGIHTVQEVVDAATEKMTALPGFSARVVALVKESAGGLLAQWSETLTPEEPVVEKSQIQTVDMDEDHEDVVVALDEDDDDDDDDESAPVYLMESIVKVKTGKKDKKSGGEKKPKKKNKTKKEPKMSKKKKEKELKAKKKDKAKKKVKARKSKAKKTAKKSKKKKG